MIVTIVAKTRQRRGACVGGITADGRSVRLIAADAAFNEHYNLKYEVGQQAGDRRRSGARHHPHPT